MHYNRVSLLSVAYADAPDRVSTEQIEDKLEPVFKRLGIPQNFLSRVTGVHARRFWEHGTRPSQAATLAGARAMAKADVDPDQIDLLINTSVSRDYVEPSVACFVHRNLALSAHCMTFDVANACVGFLNGIQIAASMIDHGHVDYALVVDGEGARDAIDRTIETLLSPDCDIDRFKLSFATLTLGSGAAAMVIANADKAGAGHRIVGSLTLSATEHNELCLGRDNHMQTDAAGLMTAGMSLAERAYPAFLEEFGYQTNEIDQFIIHQVSRPHTEGVIKRLHWDEHKVYRLFPEYGNIGPAGMPTALGKVEDRGAIARGQTIALMGIGSGLTCTTIPIEW